MKKVIIYLGLLVLLVGCTPKAVFKSYDKMQIDDKKINGYTVDLRINGTLNKNKVNKIVEISDYMNKEYKISMINFNDIKIHNEKVYYIKNSKLYAESENKIYVESKEKIKYNNPSIFLEGLKNIKKSDNGIDKKIVDNTYKVYHVTFKKEAVQKIVNDTDLTSLKVNIDSEGEIYLDNKGYVYRIIYNIDDITIIASYHGINTAREITIPILDY